MTQTPWVTITENTKRIYTKKNTTEENKINKDNGVGGWESPLSARGFWRPLPTRESRTQPKTTNNRGGGGWRGELALHMPVKEKNFLVRATHASGSGYWNMMRLVSVEAEDNGGHGGEVRGMRKLAEVRKSRF